ncbi:thymidine phosphorylase [Profundibacterium mesophilum]|uniref:Thymidine phosphorylase n=1 Tax=Profundibacterium mesophilum KAUST100406-0324 TaxID=1037889 RepID=A0A921P110_9RHOB|nr:thymidine phosphorylase [Profundibacterium mesophilum]KAF0677228.1 Thymidine phosphorylase [Profundibacterium mesophilum KAUST100406-0324]
MDARSIIGALRRGETPSAEALSWFARGLASGRVSDAQAGAFAMAVCLNGLGSQGRIALTMAMRDSGATLDWDLPGPVLDKHSTGGVGDPVSLLLAPALAACGAFVPMISGRGLGHTGGTLDKLEAIPGLRSEMDEAGFRAAVAQAGCAIVAASDDLAPADRRLYAVRDMTATVDHVDLITASILSKKLAAGLGGLVLDVKLGSGAFMKTAGEALALAEALVEAARGAGCPAAALVTDMNQPLAPCVGNAVEVAAVMEVLTGETRGDALRGVTAALGGQLLALGKIAASPPEGAELIEAAIASGAAAERFGRMVAAMGGPSDFTERWRGRLPQAPMRRDVLALEDGHVQKIDGTALGMAVLRLGGGRMHAGDAIEPAVGLSGIARLGTRVSPGDPMAVIHAGTEAEADHAERALRAAFTLSQEPCAPPPAIHEYLA